MLTKFNTKANQHENGFTLVEILVVILIIGILAAIAIPIMLNQRKSAQDSIVEADVRNAAGTVSAWAMDRKEETPVPEAWAQFDTKTSASSDANAHQINVSPGTTLRISGTSKEFLILGTNEDANNAKSENGGIVYDSTKQEVAVGTEPLDPPTTAP